MAKTRGAKTPSPSGRTRALRVLLVQDSMTEPSQPPTVPPSVDGAPPSPPLRRYETRRPPTHQGEGPQEEATESGCHSITIPKVALSDIRALGPRAPTGLEHPEIPQPEHLEEPQPVEIPMDIRTPVPAVPSTGPMPEFAFSTPFATPGTPPVVPAAPEPHSSESCIAISISEFRSLCHTLQTLTTTQSVLTQQMAIVRAHQDQLIAT
ncbi:lysine-rich arabinogalactan protein 19-like [Vitis vinifera]|uniref:lysine-rich arabinogalactan protein 19-like n=1 Tax=Vitis vinifera TaxID=29760 RepID=UPI00053FCAA1|nr:lysine-rich arabinogalactan protein 19-like [Vitis vinifera]|eukprot:XP_010657872.1 PREDICTED: lysine-rich arabinogalactan protein 19-like [Vitis vinifera]